MTPSQRLKILIERSKLTYADLETKTGISKSALQRYAVGKTIKIPVDVIEIIAPVLNVSPAYLMGWDEASKENGGIILPEPIPHPITNEKAAEILQSAFVKGGLTDKSGTLTEDGASVISDFILNNASILKKLMNEDV